MSVEPLTLLAHAVGSDDEPSFDPTGERILDAALEIAAASGVRHLTMDGVAARARVGRMTVYRRFGDKHGLLAALGGREGRRCLDVLDAAAEPDAPIAEQVAAGLVASLRLAREHPLLARLTRFEPEELLAALNEEGGTLFSLARDHLADRLRASREAGVLGEVATEEAAEILVRIALSFALIPESALPLDDEARLEGLARAHVAPILSPLAAAPAERA
jgi:AcrR family transcriptional regulator